MEYSKFKDKVIIRNTYVTKEDTTVSETNDALQKTIAEQLRKAREAAKLDQADVADWLGVARSTYSNLELGRSLPSVEYLSILSKKYDLPINFFLKQADPTGLEHEEAELVSIFRNLPDDLDRAAVMRFVRGYATQVTK